jgi:DNA polymerase II small subunit/DNA polymerase delta subunit B
MKRCSSAGTCPHLRRATPLAPEKEDFLVIDEVPTFVTAIPRAGISEYRGVKPYALHLAGTRRRSTRCTISTRPAKLPITLLVDGETRMMDFR